MNKVVCKTKSRAQKMREAIMSADKGGKEIIVELGLTVVAVALIVVFRTEIKALVDSIMTTATTTINNLFTF